MSGGAEQPRRALVVDDSRTMRALLRASVEALGFCTEEARDGAEAWSQLQEGPLPDLVLVDWHMPRMDGLQLIAAARAVPRFDPVRLVVVTVETAMARIAEALEAGADEYLMKPFEEGALRDKLVQLGLYSTAGDRP